MKTKLDKSDDPPGRLFRYYNPRLDEFDSSERTEKRKDKPSRQLVIQDFANIPTFGVKPKRSWICEEFPGDFFPVDLYVKRGYVDTDGVDRFICLELKCAENDNTLSKITYGPCQGAFIPLHKREYLGTARDFVNRFDRAGLVYVIEGVRYYIPYPVLTNRVVETQHPLRITASSESQKDREKFLKEGNLSLPTKELLHWGGTTGLLAFLDYVEKGWIPPRIN